MNYYEARQRQTDKCWDWTCQNDNRVWRVGACNVEPKCQHKTKEEANEHEASRVREEIKKTARQEIDTKKGHACQASVEPSCKDLAFEYVEVRHGGSYELCPKHLEDLSWVSVGQIISSY